MSTTEQNALALELAEQSETRALDFNYGSYMQQWHERNAAELRRLFAENAELATQLATRDAELATLRSEIETLKARSHTCGPNCSKAGCVNVRLAAENEALRAQVEALEASTPKFIGTPKRKLDDLLTEGYSISGYAIERPIEGSPAPQRGFITVGGLVGWWWPNTDAEMHALRARVEALSKALSGIAELYETDEGCRTLPQYLAARAALAGSPTPAPLTRPAVPEGWKLVPVEPTEDMLGNVDQEVGGHCSSCSKWKAGWDDCRAIWKEMLAAAPQPEPPTAS